MQTIKSSRQTGHPSIYVRIVPYGSNVWVWKLVTVVLYFVQRSRCDKVAPRVLRTLLQVQYVRRAVLLEIQYTYDRES